MKPLQLLIVLIAFIITNGAYAQEKNLTKASTLGAVMTEENEADDNYFGNWEVIASKSEAENISLMPDQDSPTGPYLFLKPTRERSSVSSYIEGDFHSVDLGFNAYRKGNTFYGNLTTSVAIVFESEHKGELITFTCEYLEDLDQLKLTTSKNVVFYLKRQLD